MKPNSMKFKQTKSTAEQCFTMKPNETPLRLAEAVIVLGLKRLSVTPQIGDDIALHYNR
jgi:hypothetical protein